MSASIVSPEPSVGGLRGSGRLITVLGPLLDGFPAISWSIGLSLHLHGAIGSVEQDLGLVFGGKWGQKKKSSGDGLISKDKISHEEHVRVQNFLCPALGKRTWADPETCDRLARCGVNRSRLTSAVGHD